MMTGDAEMLEFLLDGLYPKTKREISAALIARFGSFDGIFSAKPEELAAIDGMTERGAAFFALLRPAFCQAAKREAASHRLDNERALVTYAISLFMNASAPCEYAVYMNCDGRLIRARRLADDDRVRETVGEACRLGAEKVALLRSSTAAELAPGAARMRAVCDAAKPLEALGICVVDSIEYRPFAFSSLRRVLAGERRNIDVMLASDAPYSDRPISDKTESEIRSILNYLRSAYK